MYVPGQFLITIRGNLAGGEVWANTWAVSGTGDPQDAVDALRTFYVSWAGVCANEWTAVGASYKALDTGLTSEADWALVTGGVTTSPPLPTEVATRLTIDTGGRHGGPFLCGMATSVLDANGSFDPTDLTGVIGGLEDLVNTDLPAADFAIGVNSPTEEDVFFATRLRIGHIFDVIRRRRNRLSEAYSSITVV